MRVAADERGERPTDRWAGGIGRVHQLELVPLVWGGRGVHNDGGQRAVARVGDNGGALRLLLALLARVPALRWEQSFLCISRRHVPLSCRSGPWT